MPTRRLPEFHLCRASLAPVLDRAETSEFCACVDLAYSRDACACKPKPWSAEAKAEYRRRAVLAARTEAERIVAGGTGETAKLLAGADLKVAERTPRAREAAVPRQPLVRGLFGRYRPLRYSAGGALEPRAQARYEPPQRRFFLFRTR